MVDKKQDSKIENGKGRHKISDKRLYEKKG